MEKPFPLFILARTVISHQIWGFCRLRTELGLAIHREKTEKKLSNLILPVSIYSALEESLSLLEQAYNNAFHWLEIYEKAIPSLENNEVDLIFDRRYRFCNFITPLGKFNDTKWVIQFVDDEQQNILCRFYFACFYCLEDALQILHQEAKIESGDAFYMTTGLIRFWIDLIESNFNQSVHHLFQMSFRNGFQIAVDSGYEKAAHYFWDKLTERNRNALILRDYFDRLVSSSHQSHNKKYTKTTHFFYSKLSTAEQENVLKTNFERNGFISFWRYCLHPELISFIPEQIALHQNSLPNSAYRTFLMDLSLKMREIRNPFYQQIFHTVWKNGSIENKDYFLKYDRFALYNLFVSNDFITPRYVFKDASLKQKTRFLFKDMEELLLDRNSFRSDPSSVRTYLLLFLTDFQKESTPFHNNSLNLLQEIRARLNSSHYYRTEADLKIALSIIENLILEASNFLDSSKSDK